jgi:hypothetical protein
MICYPTHRLWWNPRPRRSTRPKRKRRKTYVVEELVIVVQTMVGGVFHDEEALSLKDLVEEAT